MRGHFRYLRFKAFPMTPRTPRCEVFWALLSNSKHSGVLEDSNSSLFPSVGLHPHTWPKKGCDNSAKSLVQQNSSYDQPSSLNKIKRTCHLAPPFSLLSYLPPSITQTFLQCSHSFHHPLVNVAPVLHNAQINKVAYPCIPCSSDGHIPIASMQKVDN